MLIFFTTAKPFRGHDGIIQRNALKSWMLLHPNVEVILFGEEGGAADVAKTLGSRHEPRVERNEFGANRRSAELRAYLTQWKKAQAQRWIYAPGGGALEILPVLLGYPWTYGEIMTRRHRVYSYMSACSALVLGYHHLHLFDDARRKRKEWTASSSEKTLVALPAKAKAAAATKS